MAHINNAQHQKTQYFKKLQLRICVSCSEPAEDDHVRCRKHADYYNAYNKERRNKRKSRGVCAICKEPAMEIIGGRLLCSKHILRKKAYSAGREAQHKALGLCRKCKREIEPDRTMCALHLEQLRESGKRRTARLRKLREMN